MSEAEGCQRTSPEQAAARICAHYELEKRLAAQLRAATPAERRKLLPDAYGQVMRLVGQVSAAEASASRRRHVAGQMRFLARFLRPDAVFCELGPGDCMMVLEVARHVKHAYAIDIECEYCKTLQGPPNFSVVFTDGTSVPVPPGSIDVAYSDQVMEHLHPDDAAEELKNIFRALKPGGVYVCTTPNRLSGPHDVSKYFDEVATGFHLKEYTVGELVTVFREAGFVRLGVYVGGRGRYVRMPLCLARLLEGIVAMLPCSLRKVVARRPPIGWLLGIQFVGFKPRD